jgi:hypothetical protein
MNRVVYNKFYGWISSDWSLWWAWSVYNIEWVDIHQDTKYIQLAKNGWNFSLLNTRTNWWITSALYESNTRYLEATYDWYITWWILYNSLNYGDVMTWYYSYIYNLWKITNSSWNTYWFWFTYQEFFYWTYDAWNTILWLLWNDTIADNSFENPWSWTVWSNWTIDWDATHTSWSTAVLSQTLTLTASQVYRFVIKTNTITSWTCTIKIAWNTILTVTATDDNAPLVEYYTASWSSELLEFIPSSDFVWGFAFTYLEEFTASDIAQTFNRYCPYNIYSNYIYVWNWNKVTRINMQTWTPIIVDVLTIDKEYTIRVGGLPSAY